MPMYPAVHAGIKAITRLQPDVANSRNSQRKVEDAVAEKMLDGTLKTGDTAKLAVEDGKLVVS